MQLHTTRKISQDFDSGYSYGGNLTHSNSCGIVNSTWLNAIEES